MKPVPSASAFCLIIAILFIGSCQKEIFFSANNLSPSANAGADQKITIPLDSVRLDGSASKDPDGKISVWSWTKISGPASLTITNAASPVPLAKKLVAGIYFFELKVTDEKGAFGKDTVQIEVENPALVNSAPIANAGADQTITLPTNSATLNGSGSTDADNNITAYSWSTVSGPTVPPITNANAVLTQVSGLAPGTYQFRLSITDAAGLSSNDTVKVTINAATTVLNCGESNRPVINAQLIAFGKLSEASSGMATVSVGNKIIFAAAAIAGDPQRYGSSAVHIFDVSTQSWTTSKLSSARRDIGIVAAGNKVFFAGGTIGGLNYFSTVDIYDVSTNTWSVANLSQPRAYIAAAAVGDKVLFAGGEQPWPLPVSDRVDIYDLTTDTWSQTTLSAARNGITALAINNKIYFAGGSYTTTVSSHVVDVVDVFDYANNSWSTTTLSEPKTFFAGIHVENKVYWAGGQNGSNTQSCLVEIKDLATQVSSTAYLFHPFSYTVNEGQNAVIKDNKIVWFATVDPLNGNATDRFNIYDISTNTWSIGVLPFKINGASIVALNNTIYVAGGSINGMMTDVVWKLEF